jgi:cytoplasmic iron level regulating protein YaaA (DUF328/UPF0246 family)
MRSQSVKGLRSPQLINQSIELSNYLKSLRPQQLLKIMHISKPLAETTYQVIAGWSSEPQTPALDCFVGDIYRGLGASDLTTAERDYADQHLYILSGLYGCLRPYDGIQPYRLEMAYKLPKSEFSNLYKYWGQVVASLLPDEITVNVSSVEYSKLVLPFIKPDKVVTPEFLTIDAKSGRPSFTAVHAKVARGAFARWMIQNQVQDTARLQDFAELGYRYNQQLSKPQQPVFICQKFGGLGLKA